MNNLDKPKETNTLESFKESTEKDLHKILYKELNPENIETYADLIIDELVDLNKKVLNEYRNNPDLNPNPDLPIDEQEDDAFKKLGLPLINQILERAEEIKNKIEEIKSRMSESVLESSDIITPPQELNREIIGGSGGVFEKSNLVPRRLTLFYILKHDFEIDIEDIQVTKGQVSDEMMRKEPYYRIDIPDLNRVLYICDEEGNITYIFDKQKLEESKIDLADLDIDDKNDKDSLIKFHPGIGIRVMQSKKWRQNISNLLENDIPEPKGDFDFDENIPENQEIKSEFEKRESGFLKWNDFVSEVGKYYELASSPSASYKWYNEEYKKHFNWPSTPQATYKNKGWKGFPDLIDKEFPEFLDWEDFVKEVKSTYDLSDKSKGPSIWYKEEYKKHSNWPSTPASFYQDKGWKGFSELFEKEFPEFLDWEDFVEGVRVSYESAGKPGGTQKWYEKEYKKHKGWPSAPGYVYKDKGWKGFSELFEKEVPEFLDWDDFVVEFAEAYEFVGRPSNLLLWYGKEYKKHKGWPSVPGSTYKNKGWKSFPELVGKEVVKFLNWNDFVEEVKSAYDLSDKNKGPSIWYEEENKKHRDWPHSPYLFYKNKGWKSFPDLVGNEIVEFLPWNDFVTEVRKSYELAGGSGNSLRWYREEQKNHSKWPSTPNKVYKNKGWKSYPDLVGK